MLNESFRYHDDELFCDRVRLADIAAACGTPAYVYSLPRVLANLAGIKTAFAALKPHIHYSAKANANLAILRTIIGTGAGVDTVSAGEIHRALKAGAAPEAIVFAGVGKTPEELEYAVAQGIGWFNVENLAECEALNMLAAQAGRGAVKIALRLNPEVTANTHPYIATGHGGAKFGLTAETIRSILDCKNDYPYLRFEGIHIHIGSQLHDIEATCQAVKAALEVIAPYPEIRTVNIGGGLPVAYQPETHLPSLDDFAAALTPLLSGYEVLLEPGRSVVADAGVLLATVLYVKQQAGQTMVITDGSMAELMRPALYKAHHEIIPLKRSSHEITIAQIVGPVCETADVLGRDVEITAVQPGDVLAVMTAGAYGMVMASNYNARPRPPEVVVEANGREWRVARQRETWDDLTRLEV